MAELRLERMVHGGMALARLPGGRLVLVRGGIPGELVGGRIAEASGVLRAEVEEVLQSSPDRLPALAHPGLDYGHIRYARQLKLKREVVLDALRRARHGVDGAIEVSEEAEAAEVAEVRPAPAIWRYRNAIQPVVVTGGLGYRLPGSASVVHLESDPVANVGAAAAWDHLSRGTIPKGVRELAIRANDDGEALVALIATSPQRTLVPFAHELVSAGMAGVAYARFDARGRFRGGSERLAGVRRLMQRYGELDLSITVASFAQPNPAAAGELYREAVSVAGGGRLAVELFAGSGALAMHLAPRFEQVEAVEIDRSSVSRGRNDARRLGLGNVLFQAADARRAEIPAGAEVIAVDPPRAGLAREVRESIDSSAAERLLYISCDPATWARDVAHFGASGWCLHLARPFDFYPHTHHVEMLSLLTR